MSIDSIKYDESRETGTKSRARIFIVDDDKLVLATLKSGLESESYHVQAFSGSEAALEAFRESLPDLVILDVRMPTMSGPELAGEMLDIEYVPIIMLSAYDDRETVKQAVEIGISNYMVKPVRPNQLVPCIEATLARFAETQALTRHTDNLRDGLEKNRVISTAVGIAMERMCLSSDLAFQQLRNLAREQRRPLRDIAAEVVEAIQCTNSLINSSPREIDSQQSTD